MSLLINALLNFLRFLRNVRRVLRRSPDFVWMPVTGALPELKPSHRGRLRRRLAPRTLAPSLEDIRARLDRVLADGRVRGVILRVENLDAGWAALEELRTEIDRCREQGKGVVAYLADGGDTRSDFSKESREQVERLLDRRFDTLVTGISAGRDISPERVRSLIDNAPYSAAEAVEKRLIDGALYEDELTCRLSSGDKPAKLVEWGEARKVLRVPYRRRTRKVVGLVGVEGTVVRGSSRKLPVPLPLLGREQAGSESVAAALRVAEKSRRVAAVLLYVDSPGGDALASDLIWREVERIRAKKSVVVLMGNAAASGGYYVSVPASRIVARKNTITGSIGVILTRPVALDLLGKLKVNPVAVERGARSNLLDLRRRPTPDELAVLNDQLHVFYDGFKDRVASGRELQPEALQELAGGRVWTGTEALEKGLVDENGGFRTALERARELAAITEDTTGVLVRISPPRGNRPAPGEPVREAVDAVHGAVSELLAARVWAVAPYEISDDW